MWTRASNNNTRSSVNDLIMSQLHIVHIWSLVSLSPLLAYSTSCLSDSSDFHDFNSGALRSTNDIYYNILYQVRYTSPLLYYYDIINIYYFFIHTYTHITSLYTIFFNRFTSNFFFPFCKILNKSIFFNYNKFNDRWHENIIIESVFTEKIFPYGQTLNCY